MSQRVTRGFGWLAIAHGLALAVLPLRGLAADAVPAGNWLPVLFYAVGMLGFVGAGLALLGLLPMRRFASPMLVLAAVYSLVGMSIIGLRGVQIGAALSFVFLFVGLWRGAAGWPEAADRHGRLWHAAAATVAVLFLAYVGVAAMTWPWHRAWGSTPEELAMALPGDRPDRNPAYEIQHAVTVDAPPSAVWAWLVQLGQDRAGFYSYDWLERAVGADIDNVLEIRPEWQTRQAGDFVRATQPGYLGGLVGGNLGWPLDEVQPGRVMVLRNWGAFVLLPTADGRTRFIIRSTITDPKIPVWAAVVNMGLFELPHFIMERRMMLTIKALAERDRPAPVVAARH
ncbi:MAG: hypothetical protein AB7H93_24560 [Vicinamibacterales bacterium]